MDGHLMPDKLMDVIRWHKRRGMSFNEIAVCMGVDAKSMLRAVDAAMANGTWKAAERILIKKRVLPDPDAPLRPKLIVMEYEE